MVQVYSFATIILKASIRISGVGAFSLFDDAEAEAARGGRIGPTSCFNEPSGVFRSVGEFGDGAWTGSLQFPVLIGNDDLISHFETGLALGDGEDGGLQSLIAISAEVKKAQSAAFSGFQLDLQNFSSFRLQASVSFGGQFSLGRGEEKGEKSEKNGERGLL